MNKLGYLFAASLIFAACGSSNKGTDGNIMIHDGSTGGAGGAGGSGGTGGTGATGGTGGSGGAGAQCNMTTGQGCLCGMTGQTCPGTSVCIQLQDSTGTMVGGPFCSNMCTSANQSTTCALSTGAPGTGVCGLVMPCDAAQCPATNCAIVCGTNMTCPSGMTGHLIGTTCVCTG